MAQLQCMRCGAEMEYSGRQQFQLGEESYFSGVLAVMTAESTCMEIYTCPDCGKIEFFTPRKKQRPTIPATDWTCSQCGEYNNRRVKTCQSCGVTRAWSEKQGREE